MKRTGWSRNVKRISGFFRIRWRLLVFWGLLMTGFAGGCVWFSLQPTVWQERLRPWLCTAANAGWLSVGSTACLYRWGMLAVLLAASVSVYGLPFTAAVPFVYGGLLGLSQCFWYSQGASDILTAVCQVLLPALPQAVTVLMASAEASRMTVALAGQLLPGGGHVGLWSLWRLCMLRFLLFLGLATVSGALETVARLCF